MPSGDQALQQAFDDPNDRLRVETLSETQTITAVDGTDATVDGTAGGVTLLAANSTRRSALIQNTGAADMRVTTDGSAPTATHGKLVKSGGSLTLGHPCSKAAVKAIRTTSTSTTANASEESGS